MNFSAVSALDIAAAEHMGKLHDALKNAGYTGHELETYLVRLLFCLFADDTGIFDKQKTFFRYITERTKEDGSDLAMHLDQLFQIMNTHSNSRMKNIDEQLNEFPYINGGLFKERLSTAAFTSNMRDTLLKCCALDWSKIKPEIFGAMFQSIKDRDARRALGEHYTSEANIQKLINPLFLDNLREELKKIKAQKSDIRKHNLYLFHDKICHLKFLDPACGCGNFLVVTYRELRLLEIDIVREILTYERGLDIEMNVRVNVDQFYGIEIEEFPARIAETALWLMDHLMNLEVSKLFQKPYIRIPITTSPNIIIGNALTLDWKKIIEPEQLSYILGNPPFVGSRLMNNAQKKEVLQIFTGLKGAGELDYVSAWYKKAAEFTRFTKTETAFVSTNSICQGLQVTILWPYLKGSLGLEINFAHQTFKWWNEAKGKAAVYCVIVGFNHRGRNDKKLYTYATVDGEPLERTVEHINSYLIDSSDIIISPRTTPLCSALCSVPEMHFGNMPADGGYFIFTKEEKKNFLEIEPGAKKWFRRYIGAKDFINNGERWCLWLEGIDPAELRKLKNVYQRVANVKELRKKSARPFLAQTPHLFAQITQPKGKNYILIPSTTAGTRKYIPIGFFTSKNIAANSCHIIPKGTLYHFGVLMSSMHMAWTRYVCGRLGNGYRYSKDIVYNNFPWPIDITEKQKSAIEEAAQFVLDARSQFPNDSLADLYDHISMPAVLSKAHQKLDKSVEKAYGRDFTNDTDRAAHLFYLYEKLNAEMFAKKQEAKIYKTATHNSNFHL